MPVSVPPTWPPWKVGQEAEEALQAAQTRSLAKLLEDEENRGF